MVRSKGPNPSCRYPLTSPVSVACVAVGLIDFNPSVQRFHLHRCKAFLDLVYEFEAKNLLLVLGEYNEPLAHPPAGAVDRDVGLHGLTSRCGDLTNLSARKASASALSMSTPTVMMRTCPAPPTTRAWAAVSIASLSWVVVGVTRSPRAGGACADAD